MLWSEVRHRSQQREDPRQQNTTLCLLIVASTLDVLPPANSKVDEVEHFG